jgi:DNA repair exonuclease SbcCD ATPase subunit
VTVLHARRDHPADAPINRLEAAETVAAAERAAREQAERALAEAQATIHDLQTKLGHASLAQTELQAAARRDQDAIAAVQATLHATNARLAAIDAAREKVQQRLNAIEDAYAGQQSARQQAERAQRDAEAARTDAERRLRQLDLNASGSGERPARRVARPAKATKTAAGKPGAMIRRGKAQPVAGALEPEPVQWWLMSARKTQRR